jgi:CRISPR/Cas system CSM-associated protein Csm4 (group 5 of RAMP superfamily)
VDRLTGHVEPHEVACMEFLPGAGLWAVISFADEEQKEKWNGPVRAALRLLADSGLGGERARGWGRAESPEFIEGVLPRMILPEQPSEPTESGTEAEPGAPQETIVSEPTGGYWLLSLFSPAADDAVDWSRGSYSVLTRNGRVESPVRSGDLKKSLQMIGEGSVLVAEGPVRGTAPDVAPEGFEHPVYRAGFALAIPVPWQAAS